MTGSGRPWGVRPYGEGDETALTALFADCFGRPLSEAHWRWKLRGVAPALAGGRYLPFAELQQNVWVAEAAGTVVGQYACIPISFSLAGRVVPAVVAVDGMVHPQWRRRGVLTTMVQAAHAHWRQAGVAFVLGLPNEQWRSRKRALGWEHLFDLVWRRRPFMPSRILARKSGLPSFLGLTPFDRPLNAYLDRGVAVEPAAMRRVTEVEPAFDVLWNGLRDRAVYTVVRDGAWVGWRYLSAPDSDYHVLLAEVDGRTAGFACARIVDDDDGRRAIVADVFADPGEADDLDRVVAGTVRYLRRTGAESATLLSVPGSPVNEAAGRGGFRFGKDGAFDVRLVRLDPELDLRRFRDPGRWVMAGGDFDVV